MRTKLFNFIKRWFYSEIDLEIRYALQELRDSHLAEVDKLEAQTTKSFDDGVIAGKAMSDSMIQRRVQDVYTQQNWLVNPAHVFQISPTGLPYLNQEPITREKAKQLQTEARALKNFMLWDVFQNTIRERAIEQGIKTSTEWSHVIPGKMMVHNLGILDKLVKTMDEVDISKIPEKSGRIAESVI